MTIGIENLIWFVKNLQIVILDDLTIGSLYLKIVLFENFQNSFEKCQKIIKMIDNIKDLRY